MEEEASDHWRLSLLFFLAKAGSAGRWSLVLNILRKLPAKHEGLEELAAHVPKSLIPKLLQLLQLNSLENDALLLEARPFASSLCKAWRTCQTAQAAEPGAAEDSSDTKSLEVLAKMASAAGYLGVIDLQTAEASKTVCGSRDSAPPLHDVMGFTVAPSQQRRSTSKC